jgi:ABC-type sugar transport system ATPase subunit
VADLTIRNLTRRFASGGGVSDISLNVRSGEFLVLLGPSGCGKSTLLRLIAGLERPDTGEIQIGSASHDDSDQYRNAVAMVFQNFALYPHMTVFQNIAFPLRLRRVPPDEIQRRVKDSAAKAGLNLDLNRYPRELSGGERQRVALARALVREPEIVLMDEALSSLDMQLRASLRVELKEFQRSTGRTFVYVTHDQVEALALADVLAVMRDGRIEQIGSPEEVFDVPETEFVARFLGNPPMNIFAAKITPDRKIVLPGGLNLRVDGSDALPAEIKVGIRPSDLSVDPIEGHAAIDAVVEMVEFSGSGFIIHTKTEALPLTAESARKVEPEERRKLYFAPERLHFFDARTGRRLDLQVRAD